MRLRAGLGLALLLGCHKPSPPDAGTIPPKVAHVLVLSNTVKGYTQTLRLAQLDVDQAKLRLEIATQQAGNAEVKLAENDLARNQRQIDAMRLELRAELRQASGGAFPAPGPGDRPFVPSAPVPSPASPPAGP